MARPQDLDPVLAALDERIRAALVAADLPPGDPAFERPRQRDHGDWASTLPLRLAKPARRAPREIAHGLVDRLELPAGVAAVEVAGPGFVNFRLSHDYFEELVRRVVAEGPAYGRRDAKATETERINVEFVSANPTGPLHVGAGRWAATGDAIAALLAAEGHDVDREYYVNDAGEQVRRFGESVVLVHRGDALTDAHYRGTYVAAIAHDLVTAHGEALFAGHAGDEGPGAGVGHAVGDGGVLDNGEGAGTSGDPRVDPRVAARVGALAVEAMRERIAASLHTLGVDYEVWFSERSLHASGSIDEAIEDLRRRGHTYEQDGALFLRTTDFGDDKDRVLVRSDGRPTYFASDCAYVRDKWGRGYTRLIYLLGADHHGYVARLHAAAEALGIPSERLEIVIGQFVNLLRDGLPVKMSKRTGELITLDEVVEEVGADVTRYHFLRQSLDSTVDFDLAGVIEQSLENPVYYVQYAHARINSLIRTADDRGFDHGELGDADLARLDHPAELELLRKLAELSEAVADAAELRATQRLTRYAEELAGTFHRFYTECRVLVDDDALARARYWLAVAAKQGLANALGLLRVSAPERM